jgi:hypothetical protein
MNGPKRRQYHPLRLEAGSVQLISQGRIRIWAMVSVWFTGLYELVSPISKGFGLGAVDEGVWYTQVTSA